MRIDLDLSKDELTVLRYLTSTAASGRGDPLKDIYEEGDDEPEDPYGSLKSLAAKIDTLKTAADKPLRSMLVIGATLDDARDFIGRDFMGRIDNVAPRKLAIPDEIWPRDETMTAEFCTPDTIPTGQVFDIVVVTASLFSPPSTIVSLASSRVAKGGTLWREMPSIDHRIDVDGAEPLHVRTLGRITMFAPPSRERAAAGTFTPGGSFTVPIDGEL